VSSASACRHRGRLGVTGGQRGDGALGLAGLALALEDGVDEIALAQLAEAVDGQLLGQLVQVGERGVLQRGAGQDGHVAFSSGSFGRASGRVEGSGRRRGPA
jgi:hypothetical protein